MPDLLVNGKWVPYTGSTSTRKLYVRAFEAMRTAQKSFYCYDYASAGRRRSRTVHGISINRAERDRLPYVSINEVAKEDLPLVIVLESKVSTPANPKQLYGDKKPSLGILPLSAQIAWWEAQQDGANKYGLYNWRSNPVEAQTYIEAALRHLHLYSNGEENARDTTVQNLGAVMACCAILIDAAANNALIDNRIKSPENCDLLHSAEAMVKHLREAQEARDLAKKQENSPKSPEHPWVKYKGYSPNLKGYRKIEIRYHRYNSGSQTYLVPCTPYYSHSVQDVDPTKPGGGIDWYAAHSWRRVD